ncbi:MAG: type II secretion system protein [Candidatus Omnitrophica bacterium]|nr:type II secretion system protein [Candidatus Omnitrophota bacterium]
MICKKNAFTLIELMIAMSIFAVVAIALYSAFFAGISIWRRSTEGGNIHQQIKFAMDDIARDFRNTVHMTTDEESAFVFSGNSAEVSFITLEGAYLEEANISLRQLVKVKYEYDSAAGELIRMKAGKAEGFNIETAEKEVLFAGVDDCGFYYCYDSEEEFEPYSWEDEWDDEESRIPRGVRFVINVKAGKNNEKLSLTKTMFIPAGILGEKEIGL